MSLSSRCCTTPIIRSGPEFRRIAFIADPILDLLNGYPRDVWPSYANPDDQRGLVEPEAAVYSSGARICMGLYFIGLELDAARNDRHAPIISTHTSHVTVRVMKTDEDVMIARHVGRLLSEV